METKPNPRYVQIRKIAEEALVPHPNLGKPYLYSWIEKEERDAEQTFLSRHFPSLESDYRRYRRSSSRRQLPFHRRARRLLDDVADTSPTDFSIKEFKIRLETLMQTFRAEGEKYKSPGFKGIATPPFLEEWYELLGGLK